VSGARSPVGGRVSGVVGSGFSMIVFPVMSVLIIGFGVVRASAWRVAPRAISDAAGKDALAAGAAAKAARGLDDSRAPGARDRSRHAESETFYSNARIGRRAESLNTDTNLAGRVGLGCTLRRLRG